MATGESFIECTSLNAYYCVFSSLHIRCSKYVEIEDTKMMHKDAQNQANNNGNPKARKGKVEKKSRSEM